MAPAYIAIPGNHIAVLRPIVPDSFPSSLPPKPAHCELLAQETGGSPDDSRTAISFQLHDELHLVHTLCEAICKALKNKVIEFSPFGTRIARAWS